MNLAVLRRMINDGDMSSEALRYLLDVRSECEWIDFKQELSFKVDKQICDFVKDVLAIKNVGGGYIVVGVEDKTWEPLGLNGKISLDTKSMRDQVHRCAKVDIELDLVHHELLIQNVKKLFAFIFIRSTKKMNKLKVPTLVGHDFCIKESFGLRRGEIYVRSGDSTIKIDTEKQLEQLLYDLQAQVDHDSIEISSQQSPFSIEDGTFRLLEKGFDNFIGRTKIRKKLIEAVVTDPRIWIVNVHGPGGVGKSALVNWAVYEFYRDKQFEAIIHLSAKDTVLTSAGIQRYSRSLYSLENLLDHILITFQEKPPVELENKISLAIEILIAWKVLLVLDNMETVNDGRILRFIQQLPPNSKAKVLITSREKTGGWELPFPVQELNESETEEFLKIKSGEMAINLSLDNDLVKQIWKATGGLPLAIQWLLGRYKVEPDLNKILTTVNEQSSPVLEFSFGNIWKRISPDAKAVLAIMTIFEEHPTIQQLSIATEFLIERIDRALGELSEVTLVTRASHSSTGKITYIALPITLSFARHQLGNMGDFELNCRQRNQRFIEQMNLQESELIRFQGKFLKFGLESDNDKRAAFLCQKGQSEMFSGNVANADLFFKQARDVAPQCAYIFAMSASYELARNRIGNSIGFINEACQRATKKTGNLCYTIKARVLQVQGDKMGRVAALKKAIEYDPDDLILRHQYGVALSVAGHPNDAVDQFTLIIEKEREKAAPTETLLMALRTRMINLRRLNKNDDLKRDWDDAQEIFRRYPYFAREAEEFLEVMN